MFKFSEEQIERYSRQIILPEVGGTGQKKICQAKVIVLGAGGLGSPASLYLVAAGVGILGIVDSDAVDLSNLSRQIVHNTEDLGKPKAQSANEKLSLINPDVKINLYQERLTSENILRIIKDYDLVVDGTDNFPARFLVNDACFLAKKPLVHGAILRFEGQATTIIPGEGPCYRCVFREPPPPGAVPNCQQAGVIGAIAGIVGAIQAAEALKIILGKDSTLKDRLLIIDAMEMAFREVKVRKDPDCPLCGKKPTITEPVDYDEACAINPTGEQEK